MSDIGSGIFVNESNHWILAGIMCNKVRSTAKDSLFKFTNVVKFNPWIKKLT